MSNTIIIKKSETQGTAPTTSNLALGELAVNTYDGEIFLKKKVGATESIVKISAAEDWNYFADKWSTAPTEVGTVSSPVNGRVFSYTLNSVTRYRLVPDTYAPANDSFYGTYTGGVLSNLITSRSS